MTDGTAWLAAPRPMGHVGYRVVVALGLTRQERADRLAATVEYEAAHIAVPVGELSLPKDPIVSGTLSAARGWNRRRHETGGTVIGRTALGSMPT
ncbi:hypothetical protein [Streptomyces sp. NPDC057939]|uniref:hypothetical protein n=1 Tax=Streptomyces sp. NPDC057939 TaxID=3346284 RepID=UPI0036EA0E88